MKKVKLTIVVLLALGILSITYFVGYHFGLRDDDRKHLALSLDMDVYLYQKAERGDLAGVKSQLGFFILGQFNFYAQHFGDKHFLHYDDARQIATVAATNGTVLYFKK
jgi:hypothetical protein